MRRQIYLDGVSTRLHNRRISMTEKPEGFTLQFVNIDREHASMPACSHYVVKKVARVTTMNLSVEAMEALIEGYLAYKKIHKTKGNINVS